MNVLSRCLNISRNWDFQLSSMKSTTESLTRRHFTSDCCTVKLTLVQRVSDGDRNGEDAVETWIFTDTQCHASGQGQVLLQSLSLLSYTLTSLNPAPSSVPHPSPHSSPQGQVLLQSMPVHCCTYTQTFCDAWSRWCRLLYGCMWNDWTAWILLGTEVGLCQCNIVLCQIGSETPQLGQL